MTSEQEIAQSLRRDAHETRALAVQRVLIATLVLNILVALAKLIAGARLHLLSLSADGLHSSFDSLNNIVGLVALRIAARPPDAGHPYGHRKFETFGALAIGVSLGAVGLGLLRASWQRLHGSVVPEPNFVAFIVVIATVVVNLSVAWYERRRGQALGSELLIADAAHTLGDVLVSVTVLCTLVAMRLGVPYIDVVATFGIAVFIAWTAWRVLRASVEVLADASTIPSADIARVVLGDPNVIACHKIRSRGPSGHTSIDLHVEVDGAMSTHDSHTLSHTLANRLRAELPGVIEVLVHVEPRGSRDAECADPSP